MNRHCIQIDLTLNVSAAEWLAHCERAVDMMLAIPGLEWKLWLLDEARGTAGGVYLFADEASADAYLAGPVVAHLRTLPAIARVDIRRSPTVGHLSARTFALRAA